MLLDRRYHNRELQMMKVMEHENIVRLRHFFEKSGRKKVGKRVGRRRQTRPVVTDVGASRRCCVSEGGGVLHLPAHASRGGWYIRVSPDEA